MVVSFLGLKRSNGYAKSAGAGMQVMDRAAPGDTREYVSRVSKAFTDGEPRAFSHAVDICGGIVYGKFAEKDRRSATCR